VVAAAAQVAVETAGKFHQDPPRFLFSTGKGGVGKTPVAYVTALELASCGKCVLLVSTDSASNIGQVFGLTIGDTINGIPLCLDSSRSRSILNKHPRPTGSE